MSLLTLLCVLALEQLRAMPAARVAALLDAYADFLERHFNGGEYRHGAIAWASGVAVPALAVLLLSAGLAALHPLLGFAADVLLLYFLLGFRQFSHYFTDIQLALRLGELARARQLLAEWRGRRGDRLGSDEIARLTIEQGIVAAHRHVLAPIFWFVVLGPAGALLYRLALGVDVRWRRSGAPLESHPQFGLFAQRAFALLDWLPVRLTAFSFAIVGDFEDAVQCWRTQSRQWIDAASGILLASGAGALGVRLGMPLPDEFGLEARPELGLGDPAGVEHLQSASGLVWRATVLCLLLLALLTLAYWAGA